MNKMDYDGLLMCRMQGRIFELSLEEENDSEFFIRNYMNSNPALLMDKNWFLNSSQLEWQVLEEIEETYGKNNFGKEKFSLDEMYWIGYVYRFWAYTFDMKSSEIYKMCNGNEMRNIYLPYHTMDPLNAIERIMEAKEYTPIIKTIEKEKMKISPEREKELIERTRKLIEEKLGISESDS
ncbi:MAG: antitoxin [Erysipelotrichaceae bacterium]|nr:antitoxin [Erysipelotrichaceae bacterium]